MKGKKPVKPVVMLLFLLLISVFFASSSYRAKECAKMGVCLANLKQLGSGCSVYADNFGGVFPPSLSLLYPDYVNSLDTFICPSRKPKVTEADVRNDFTVCYEYVSGLTKKDDLECLLLYDREGNHRIGHHKGDRNVVFIGGNARMVKKTDWQEVSR